MHGDRLAEAEGGVEEGRSGHHQGQQKNRTKVNLSSLQLPKSNLRSSHLSMIHLITFV